MLLAAWEALAGAPPDIPVNNAGIQHVASVQDFLDDRWDEVVGLNLSATFRLTTPPRCTASSPARANAPMSRPSMGCSA